MLEHEMTSRTAGIHDEGTALRSIVAGTATETGERFFAALVESLAKALRTHAAWVTEYLPETRRLRAHALWMGGQFVQKTTSRRSTARPRSTGSGCGAPMQHRRRSA